MTSTVTDPSLVPLTEVLSALREQLAEAQMAAAGEKVVFTLTDIELEFTVAYVAAAEGGAKGKFFFVDLSAKTTTARTREQVLRLKLTPLQIKPDGTRGTLNVAGGGATGPGANSGNTH